MADQILPGPSLTPVASPVDRYVAPNLVSPEPNVMTSIAQSLKSINPQLQKFIGTSSTDMANRDAAAGALAEQYVDPEQGLEANREGWRKLIDGVRKDDAANGTDNASQLEGASPHFRRGLVTAKANRIGLGLDTYMKAQWEEDRGGIKSQDDPAAVKQWLQEVAVEYGDKMGVNGIDPIIAAKTYTPRIAQAQDSLYNGHMSFRAAERARAYRAELAANAAALAAGFDQALGSAETVGQIQGLFDEAIANGMKPADATKGVMEAIKLTALENGDEGYLDILNDIKTPYGPLGNTKAARKMRIEVAEDITDEAYEEEQRAWTRDERARTEDGRNIMMIGFDEILRDPEGDHSSAINTAMAAGRPELAERLRNISRQVQSESREIVVDHDAVVEIRTAILEGKLRQDELVDMVEAGNGIDFGSSTALSLLDDIKQAQSTKDRTQDASVRRVIDEAAAIVKGDFFERDILGPILNDGLREQRDFRLSVGDELTVFLEENPDASVARVRMEARNITDRLLKSPRYTRGEDRAPATAADIAEGAAKLGMTEQEFRAFLIERNNKGQN